MITLQFLYILVSARLERTVQTAPMLFTAAGMKVFLSLHKFPAWHDDYKSGHLRVGLGAWRAPRRRSRSAIREPFPGSGNEPHTPHR